MAWTAPATVITGDLLTASLWNAQVRDNMLETAAATAAAAGDLIFADGVNSMGGRLAASAGKYLRFNAAGNAVEAAAVTPPVVDGIFWGSSFGTRYHARLGAQENLFENTIGTNALFDASNGWMKNGTLTRITDAPQIAATGDMNSATDKAGLRLSLALAANSWFASPRVVGGWEHIQAATKVLGAAPTTITIGMIANAPVTTADAGDGFGISNDEDAAIGTAGVIAIINGATNFEYRNGAAAAVSLGVAKDTDAHLWEFVINIGAMTMDIKIDGTVRASAVALNQDEWPKGLFNRSITAVRWEHSFWWVYYE